MTGTRARLLPAMPRSITVPADGGSSPIAVTFGLEVTADGVVQPSYPPRGDMPLDDDARQVLGDFCALWTRWLARHEGREVPQ